MKIPPKNKSARELFGFAGRILELEGFPSYACVSLAPKGVRAAPEHLGVRVVIVMPLVVMAIITFIE